MTNTRGWSREPHKHSTEQQYKVFLVVVELCGEAKALQKYALIKRRI